MLQITLAATLVPSALLMWYFHSRDAYPEPPRVLWATFGLGVLIVIPVLIVALPTIGVVKQFTNPYASALASAFLSAAIPEELFKFAVLWFYCARHREFNEPIDGIVYGVAASLGFATLENVLYVAKGGLVVAILRALTAVPGHACTGAIMGYFVGRARFEPAHKSALMLAALAWPILLHGLYDYGLMTASALNQVPDAPGGIMLVLVLVSLGTLIVEVVWALVATHRLRAQQRLAPHRPVAPIAATSSAGGWLMIVGGGVLACGGGFILLAMAVAALVTKDQSALPALGCLGVVFGFVPFATGVVLFGFGIRALNRAGV